MDSETRHHLNAGREFYQAGEYDRARPHLEAVLRDHDGFADVHNMMGIIQYQELGPKSAVAHFERALALNPRYTEAALNLSVCYNELGRYEDAKDVYAKVGGGQLEAGHVDRLDPYVRGKIANLHADVGAAYQGVGLLEAAADEFRKALDLCPTFVDIRTKLATTLRDMGDLDGAIDELVAIRESAPDYLPGRIHLGVTLWRAGRIQEARSEWQHVVRQDPDNRSCRVYLSLTDGHD